MKFEFPKNLISSLSIRQKSVLATILIIIITAAIIIWHQHISADINNQSITSQAGAKYCIAGESNDLCNPTSGLYSKSTLSNMVAVTETIKNIKMSIVLRIGSNQAANKVLIQIMNPPDNSVVAEASNQTIASDGALNINDNNVTNALNDNTQYLIRLKVPGFLGKSKLTTNVLSQPVIWSAADMPIWGDFDGNNNLTIADLITMIRAKNGGTDVGSQLVVSTLGHNPTLSDLITWIRNHNNNPKGD